MNRIHRFLTARYHQLTGAAGAGPLWAVAVGAGLCLLGTSEAWGRAGGGDSFGGGGGGYSSGSSGSSSGSNGADIYIIIQIIRGWLWFCYHYPYIGLPLTVLGGYIALRSYKGAHGAYTGQVIRSGERARLEGIQLSLVDRVRKTSDAAFNKEAFAARVETAFRTAQDAWCAQDLNPLRPFVSDGIYERWNLQIARQKAEGWRDQMSGLTVKEILLAGYDLAGQTEELTVCISARASDVRVSLDNGSPLAQQNAPEEFSEYWTFLRRRGAKSPRDGQGLMEGRCPNCGTPVGINQFAQCKSCGAFLRSGEYDWILTEITQASVYKPRADATIPGLGELRTGDPEFCPRLLEDRASVTFWRWQSALWAGKPDALRGICADDFYAAIAKQLKSGAQDYRDPAVGGVDLLGVLPGETENRALIQVVWSGLRTGADGAQGVHRQLLVFSRPVGATSEQSNRTGSAHCPSCGAPEQADTAGRCTYCGQPLLTGGQWRLDQLLAYGSEKAAQYLTSLRSPTGDGAEGGTEEAAEDLALPGERKGFNPSAYAVVGWMAKMMTADGELDAKERELLLAAAQARGLPRATAEHLIKAGMGHNLEVPEPANRKQAYEWLQAIIRAALIDGKVKQQEMELLQKFALKAGYNDFDLEQEMKRMRGELYREGRENIRQTKELKRTVSLTRPPQDRNN